MRLYKHIYGYDCEDISKGIDTLIQILIHYWQVVGLCKLAPG